MDRDACGSLPEHGNEDNINFLAARKRSMNEKEGDVIRFFVIYLIKLWKGQVDSTYKRNRYCTYSNQKREDLQSIYRWSKKSQGESIRRLARSPAHSMLSEKLSSIFLFLSGN
jgi:hypothetical protein